MEVMRCYEQKLQSQSIDIQRLQESHNRLKSEQTNCQTMHQQPEMVVENLKERQRYKIISDIRTDKSVFFLIHSSIYSSFETNVGYLMRLKCNMNWKKQSYQKR